MTPDSLNFGPDFDVAVRSRTGGGPRPRTENQDNYLLIDFEGHASFLRNQEPQHERAPHWAPGHARLAVLDGMGGHGHGREAAEAVVAGLLAMPPCATGEELATRLDALHTALQQRFAEPGQETLRPGTTLTMLELRPGQPALLYHVGDSRLYEIDAGGALPLTVDHVPATTLAMAGIVDEQSWWRQVHGEHWPQIAQAFLLGNAFTDPAELDDALVELDASNLPRWLRHLPDRRPIALRPGAAYLLATDGFWSCADPFEFVGRWPALFGACGSAAETMDALFAEIERRPPAGRQSDNLTALVLRVDPGRQDETAFPVGN